MHCRVRLPLILWVLGLILPTVVGAQRAADDKPTPHTTGGLSLGVSGFHTSAGTTAVADLMWVGAEMNDGIGLRVLRQARARDRHGYGVMLVIGGPPRDSTYQWMRLDFGLGYVGEQSAVSRSFFRRHGIGALLGATIAPRRFGIVRPELNAYGVAGTSTQYLGASLGLRLLDPRQR
jgi:hypothetical protein